METISVSRRSGQVIARGAGSETDYHCRVFYQLGYLKMSARLLADSTPGDNEFTQRADVVLGILDVLDEEAEARMASLCPAVAS
jgi:hypothetical protein